MNKAHTEELNKKYPFVKSSGNAKQDLMMFGFECGDGWFDILDHLFSEIAKVPHLSTEFRVLQVKEKFGTLRVYVTEAPDRVFELIDEAEKKSEVTCQVCGAPGKMRGTAWVYVSCDEHMAEADKCV